VRARLFSSPLQAVLTLYAIASVGFLVLALAGKIVSSEWYLYPIDLAAFALWLRGVTAWAEVDDAGVRWRYWMKYDYAWHEVTRIALGQRVVSQVGPGPDVSQPAILVRTRGDEDFIRPAASCWRHRKEFGTAVVRFAAAHHKHTEVIGKHWTEPATTEELPWA
jgi:hypothetical protein